MTTDSAKWDEDYYFGSDLNLLDGEMEIDSAPEAEFVLDMPEYWDNYREVVMNLTNQILGAAAPSAKDEPK